MGQRNIAALFEEPGRGLAMLAFDERGGLLTFTSGGELYMARQTDIGLSQLTGLAAGARDSVLDRLVLELQRSLDHFDRQFPPSRCRACCWPRFRPTSVCRSIWPKISTSPYRRSI